MRTFTRAYKMFQMLVCEILGNGKSKSCANVKIHSDAVMHSEMKHS